MSINLSCLISILPPLPPPSLSLSSEIQLALDQSFMSLVLNDSVNITVQAETFPKIFQQPSLASKQVVSSC